MREYLQAMQAAPYLARDPPERPLTIVARFDRGRRRGR